MPAKIFYSPDEREAHTFADVFDDDIAEYTARGVPLERIDQIRERSRKFLAKLRCHILCLVELAQFFEHKDAFFAAIDEIGKIVTVEDHNIINGLGTAVCEVVAELGRGKVKRIGIPDRFGESAPYERLLAKNGITIENIAEQARRLLA